MTTVTLIPATELRKGDVLPLMADAVVESVTKEDKHDHNGSPYTLVRVTFAEAVVSPRTGVERESIAFFPTDKVHAVREA